MSKTLVAFFSAGGVTRRLAKMLAEILEADTYEIKPAIPYNGKDLNWNNSQSRSSIEMANINSRPELADKAAQVADYDTIFLGFPIWWYVAPHIINSFLESYNFDGKTIIVFATSGGSGFGETLDQLKPSCAESVQWIEGKVFRGRVDKKTLSDWLKTLLPDEQSEIDDTDEESEIDDTDEESEIDDLDEQSELDDLPLDKQSK